MKIRNFLTALSLGTTLAASAQWPSPLNLNTATNATNTGTLTVENNWQTSTVSINTGYTTPVVVAPQSTWYNPPVGTTAAWISYPHNCLNNSNQSESWCEGLQLEEYYKITVTLPNNPGVYTLNYTVYADNCVYKMYLNGTASANCFYTAPYSANYYGLSGFSTAITGIKNNGWVAGVNTIYIHVKSGNTSTSGNTGLLFKATGSFVAGDSWPPAPTQNCCLGNLCSDSQNALTGDYEIPLGSSNFNFSGDANEISNKVNVGYLCGNKGPGKFNAFTSLRSNNAANGPESVASYGESAFNGAGTAVGVMGFAHNFEQRSLSVGVWGDATGGYDNIGGRFFASRSKAIGNMGYNIGVSAVALPSTNLPAPKTYTNWYNPQANIGIYAVGEPANSRSGSPGMDWAGWFDGDVYFNGTGYDANMSPVFSDRKFKKDIVPIENASAAIAKLKPSNYFLMTDNEYGMNFSDKKQFGFISQEVEEIFPDLITNVQKPAVIDNKGIIIKKAVEFKALNYIGFIALLTKGMQEQQALIEEQAAENKSQQQQIDELKALVNSLADNKGTGAASAIAVNLSDKNNIVLNQNVPNPFAESTVISYNIPVNFTKAQIQFSTNDGTIIKSVDISTRGAGKLNIFADDLSHGHYNYTLVVDGKIVEVKKMVKE